MTIPPIIKPEVPGIRSMDYIDGHSDFGTINILKYDTLNEFTSEQAFFSPALLYTTCFDTVHADSALQYVLGDCGFLPDIKVTLPLPGQIISGFVGPWAKWEHILFMLPKSKLRQLRLALTDNSVFNDKNRTLTFWATNCVRCPDVLAQSKGLEKPPIDVWCVQAHSNINSLVIQDESDGIPGVHNYAPLMEIMIAAKSFYNEQDIFAALKDHADSPQMQNAKAKVEIDKETIMSDIKRKKLLEKGRELAEYYNRIADLNYSERKTQEEADADIQI